MKVPPLVGLLTDFGTRDGYVGAMKGSVLLHCPDARIIDVSHHVPPQDVVGGAFLLGCALEDLPPSTVHVAVVDPGVGTERRALAVRTAMGTWVVGPDNGLLGVVGDVTMCIELDPARVVPGSSPSPTFHGRDLFAPAGARLAHGEDPSALGDATVDAPRRLDRPVRVKPDKVEGEIVWIDRFGNAVTMITAEDLVALGDGVDIRIEDIDLDGISETYADVERGRTLAYWGSHRTLEIGQRDAHFATRQGIGRGQRVRIRRAGS